jgi:hypothetical protein
MHAPGLLDWDIYTEQVSSRMLRSRKPLVDGRIRGCRLWASGVSSPEIRPVRVPRLGGVEEDVVCDEAIGRIVDLTYLSHDSEAASFAPWRMNSMRVLVTIANGRSNETDGHRALFAGEGLQLLLGSIDCPRSLKSRSRNRLWVGRARDWFGTVSKFIW